MDQGNAKTYPDLKLTLPFVLKNIWVMAKVTIRISQKTFKLL